MTLACLYRLWRRGKRGRKGKVALKIGFGSNHDNEYETTI